MTSGRRVLAVAAGEQPALERRRDGGRACGPSRRDLAPHRTDAAADPLQQRFASAGSPRSCQAWRDSATATSAGHSRSCTSVSFPRISFAQATVSSIRLSVSKISFPFGWPHHDPRIASPAMHAVADGNFASWSSSNPCLPAGARPGAVRPRSLRWWEEEEGFEPPALSRYGFQDRRLRPLGHSSGLTFLVEPGPSYPIARFAKLTNRRPARC